IVYDTNKVKPEEVATYESLASPRFKGKVCVRSSDNVYNLSIMAAMIEHWGPAKAEQWARGVVANMARQPEGGDTDQIRAVAAGVCEVALSNTYYYLRIADSKDAKDVEVIAKTKLAFPAFEGKGTHVNISGGGVAKHAPNKAAAIKFLEFMTTPEAQKIFAEANYEYPVVAGVETPAVVSASNTFTADPVSVRVYGTRQAEAQSLFSKAGWR
ncbi:MAG: extracellular solute-binding protein, partial [Asticcacaulis sp.]